MGDEFSDSGLISDFSDSSFSDSGGSDSGSFDAGSMIPTGLGNIFSRSGSAGAATGVAGGLIGNAGRLARRGAGMISTAMGNVSVVKTWALVKKFGPDLIAGAVGMSAVDLLRVLIDSGVTTRGARGRRRGISARDVRCTKRVVRFVNHMQREIGCVSTPRHHFSKRSKRACA